MIFFYIVILVASVPIIRFLLAPESSNKIFVFSFSFMVLGLSLFAFISRFSFIGSVQEYLIADEIKEAIYDNRIVESRYLNKFTKLIPENDKITWLEDSIIFAVENNSLMTAEQLVEFGEPVFTEAGLQLQFYSLFSILRDKKFPEYRNSKIITAIDIPPECFFNSLSLLALINNGPAVPIGQKTSEDPNLRSISISNIDALIPGFDLASALINDEKILIKAALKCDNNLSYSSTFLPQNTKKNTLIFSGKINEKDWSVNPQ